MSKCREAYEAKYPYPYSDRLSWEAWQAAWNARGKVDAEICIPHQDDDAMDRQVKAQIKEAIEQENEK